MLSPSLLKPSAIAVLSSSLLLVGCGADDSDGKATGKLSMAMTDAPVDEALGVYVQFSGVVLIKADEQQEEFLFDEPMQVNLLDFQNGLTFSLLNEVTVEAGEYSQIRLLVDTDELNDTYIETAVGSFELTIPSGEQTGLKLVSGFTVNSDETVALTLDFDLRKSVTLTGNGEYKLRPTIRIVESALAGAIAGTVASDLCAADDKTAIYVYEGEVAEPDDLGSDDEPLATASVSAELDYSASFLAPGDYTVALTCISDSDDPETDETVFGNGEGFVYVSDTVTVEASQTTTLNLVNL
ncbi:MAG: DUF4382 domain-containing protein [Thalassolituus sp.]